MSTARGGSKATLTELDHFRFETAPAKYGIEQNPDPKAADNGDVEITPLEKEDLVKLVEWKL